jgi:hypothetical protein
LPPVSPTTAVRQGDRAYERMSFVRRASGTARHAQRVTSRRVLRFVIVKGRLRVAEHVIAVKSARDQQEETVPVSCIAVVGARRGAARMYPTARDSKHYLGNLIHKATIARGSPITQEFRVIVPGR